MTCSWYIHISVSEEPAATIFTVGFYTERGISIFFKIVGTCIPKYMGVTFHETVTVILITVRASDPP
jgi:hypothetical protein